jgi:diacylglycerol kinase family enzyme
MAVSAQEASTEDKPYRNRLVALVLNGQAGALLGQADSAAALAEKLGASGAEVRVIPPDAGTLPERMAQAKASGADCVVVAGGDGTIACAAAALAGSGVSLGLIPCGTMNLLAKDLHIDPGDHDAAIEILTHGRPRAIDVGVVGGHVFLCASMLGTPARLSRHREAGRQRGNGVMAWAGFASAALRALTKNRSLRVVLRADGKTMKLRSPSITVTVNRLDDDSARLFGRSDLAGGKLGVYVVRRSSALRQVFLLVRTVLAGKLRDPEIDFFTTGALDVVSAHAAMHVLVDGELRLMKPPLRYEIQPGALRVIAPREH